MQLPLQALCVTAGVTWVATRTTLDGPGLPIIVLIAASLLCSRRYRPWALPFVSGVLWAWLRAWMLLQTPLPTGIAGSDLTLIGDVVSLPEVRSGRSQFDFAPRDAGISGLPSRVRLSWFSAEPAPRAAETWQLVVRLRPPRGFANPGGYDYEGELFRARIGATGYVRESARNLRVATRNGAYPVLALRAAIARRIERTLGNSPEAGIIAGLAVGASQGISAEQWRVFAATGTTHLIAISGLHITMVAALAMLIAHACWGLWRGAPRWARADVTCLCGAVAALAYAMLAGFSVPTQRTLVMLLCALGAMWLRRAQPPSNVLSLALIVVLIHDPHAVLTAGLWLSFVAVAAIILGVGSFIGRDRPLRTFLTTQAVVSIALVPVTALLFGSVSLVSPAVNLLAIPLFSGLLVPATLVAIALMLPFPWLADLVLWLTARVLELSWPVLEWAAALPGALMHLPAPAPWQSVVLGASAVVMISPLPRPLRALGLLSLFAIMASDPARPAVGAFTLTALDVGQGSSVVVRTHAHTLLFDAGPAFRGGRSAGELVVVPYLYAQGIRRLDMLVMSHPDNDHTGGVVAVEQAFRVATARKGGGAAAHAPACACQRGEAWVWDGVHFRFLHPRATERWNDNNGSCVLLVSAGATRALITGDIERAAEDRLLTGARLPRAEVVVVPHHGSRSSSGEALVKRLQARFAIVSAGAANRWGFPHESVVRRWCAAGAQVIGTAEWGAITIALDPTGAMAPRSYRLEHRRYWHARASEAGQTRCRGP